jgi:hypothetical protein
VTVGGGYYWEHWDRVTRFEAGGSACQMNGEQQENLKAWVAAALPRSTRAASTVSTSIISIRCWSSSMSFSTMPAQQSPI